MKAAIVTSILVIGPIFDMPSGLSGQGGKLNSKLNINLPGVLKVSRFRNKVIRIIDTLCAVIFKKNKYDIILLQSFGLLTFIMEDAVSIEDNPEEHV